MATVAATCNLDMISLNRPKQKKQQISKLSNPSVE